MFQNNNFISINDLSPTALCLWASPSIINCLGYEPEEVVGVSPYQWIHPDDMEGGRVAHKETLVNEIAGTQLFVRFQRKDGTYSQFMTLAVICYQFLICRYTCMNEEEGLVRNTSQFIVHSAAMTNLVGSEKEELERFSRNHKNLNSTWNPANFDMELRACLFLNRFTRNLRIMYASPSCELILSLDPDDLRGRPLLLYIRADDLASFVEQADLAKSTDAVSHLRFWFQSPNCSQEIPLEAVFLGAADALIIIFRKCPPFRRRQFITNYSSQEYITRRRPSNTFGRNYNISNRGNNRNRGWNVERTEPYSRYGHVHSIRGSPSDSLSSSSDSASSPQSHGTRAYQAPLSTYVGSINSIRNLDNEQTRLRPLASFHADEDDIVEPKAKDLLVKVHTQDSEVETLLVEEFEAIKLVPDRKKVIKRKEDIEEGGRLHEGDYFGEGQGITTVDESVEEIQMPYSIKRHRQEE